MILVDTSIWIDHLRCSEAALVKLLNQGKVLIHSFVIGELACGSLQNRQEILMLLHNLPQIKTVSQEEALFLIENRLLMSRGIGYIDVHLLASVLIQPGSELWTRDKRLSIVSREIGVDYEP